ncbi:MAG: hypothetical protein QM497_09415 [Sulfurimonas sp.]
MESEEIVSFIRNNFSLHATDLDNTVIENIREAIPILNTQKYKDRPALAGVALYEKLFGIAAALSDKERIYNFSDQWCKEQFLEYMITDKDLTYTHFKEFMYGFIFVSKIGEIQEDDTYNVHFRFKNFFVSHKVTCKFNFSETLINDIASVLFRHAAINDEISKEDFQKYLQFFPSQIIPNPLEIAANLKKNYKVTVIGDYLYMKGRENSIKNLSLENIDKFEKRLQSYSRNLYTIEILDIFSDVFGFVPINIRNDDIYELIKITESFANKIVINSNYPGDEQAIEMIPKIAKMIFRYLSSNGVRAIYPSLLSKYFALLSFSVNTENLKNLHNISKEMGIVFYETEEEYIDYMLSRFINEHENIYLLKDSILMPWYKKQLAPESLLVDKYIPLMNYTNFKKQLINQLNIPYEIDNCSENKQCEQLIQQALNSQADTGYKIKYVENFTSAFNISKNIIYLKSDIDKQFNNLWESYFERVTDTLNEIESLELLFVTENKKNYFHDMHKIFFIADEQYKKLNFYTLLKVLEISNAKKESQVQQTIYGFLLYLSNLSIAQLPLEITLCLTKYSFQVDTWLNNNPSVNFMYKISIGRNYKKNQMLFALLATSSNIDPIDIHEEDVNLLLQQIDAMDIAKYTQSNIKSKIRDMFITLGNIHILSYEEYKANQESSPNIFLKKYGQIDEFKYLAKATKLFMENNSASLATRVNESKLIEKFFNFLENFHFSKGTIFEKVMLEAIFSGDSENSLQEWIDSEITQSQKNKIQNVIAQICERSPYLSGAFKSIYRKNYNSNATRKKSFTPSRYALDEEVLFAMRNTVLNDPPQSDYYKNDNTNKEDHWYAHIDKAEPLLPAMLLLHIKLPHRAEHIRTLDLNKFLIRNNDGSFAGFEMSTDKNWRRTDIFTIDKEIVKIMFDDEELSFIEQCNSYIYNFFEHIRPIYQHSDQKNVWGQIVPMFPNKKGTDFIPKNVYKGYNYKVLIKALLSLDRDPLLYLQKSPSISEETFKAMLQPQNNSFRFEFETEEYIAKNIKSTYYGPHALRKSNITRYISYGHPLEVIMSMTGHKSINSIMVAYIDYKMLSSSTNFKKAKNIINKDISVEDPLNMSREYIKKIRNIFKVEDKNQIERFLKKLDLKPPPSIIDSNGNLIPNSDGLNTSLESSPITWKPLPWGICTGIECPPNLTERCGACPYLLTNELFIRGIKLAVMLSTAKIAKIGNGLYLNMKNKKMDDIQYANHVSFQKDQIIDFYAWQILIDVLHEKIYEKKDNTNKLPLVTAEHMEYNMGLIEIFTEAKACYYNSKDIHAFQDELAGTILKLLIQKKVNFDEIPYDNSNAIIPWFMDMLKNSNYDEKHEIIEALKNPNQTKLLG